MSVRRIAPREGRPEEVLQVFRGHIALIHHHHQRKAVDRVAPIVAAAELATTIRPGAGRPSVAALYAGPSTTKMPGKNTRGRRNPSASGKASRLSQATGSVRSGGPAAAITTFDPSFSRPPL